MAFRTQSNAAPDAFDAVIAGAPANATLAELDSLIDWAPVRTIFAATYDSSGRGQAGFDPVVLYKMLLLEELYALSDVQASREAGDRISFRRFLGLGVAEAPPDDTTLVRFRARVRPGALLEKARHEVERRLAAHRLRIQPGSVKVVDATLVPAATRPPKGTSKTDNTDDTSASSPSPEAPSEPVARASDGPSAAQEAPPRRSRLDPDARFGGKKGRLRFAYKMHTAIDAASGVISDFRVTPANVADTSVFAELLEEQEAAVLADKGYDSAANRAALAARGARDGIMRRLFIDPDSLMGRIEVARNQKLARLRAPSEGVFASLKRWRRLPRAIYTGIERVTQQVQIAVTVHNALKYLTLRQKCA